MKLLLKIIAGLAVLAAAGWFGVQFLERQESQQRGSSRSQSTTVVVAAVQREAEELRLNAVGTSRALQSVSIYPASAGEVKTVNFTSGQSVAAGDLLLELDARDEKLALELAEIRLQDAQQLVDRYSKAKGSDAVPVNDRQAAQTALAAAKVERNRAQVALDDRYVRAPFAGKVGIRDIDVGDRVDTSTLITTLDDRSALLVTFELPEAMLGAATVGQSVSITSWNQPDKQLQGEMVDVGSRIDPVSRTIVARARVPNEEDSLRPGMSFRVQLSIGGNEFTSVPEIAVLWGADGAYLWSVQDGNAHRTPLQIVQRKQGRVLIDSSLDMDAMVVVEGLQSMREGRPVEIVDTLEL